MLSTNPVPPYLYNNLPSTSSFHSLNSPSTPVLPPLPPSIPFPPPLLPPPPYIVHLYPPCSAPLDPGPHLFFLLTTVLQQSSLPPSCSLSPCPTPSILAPIFPSPPHPKALHLDSAFHPLFSSSHNLVSVPFIFQQTK